MKYTVIAYYDKDLECFKLPQVINCPEISNLVTDLIRGLVKMLPDDKVVQFGRQELYHLGYYDDETGCLEALKPVKVLDCDEMLERRMKVRANEQAKQGVIGS